MGDKVLYLAFEPKTGHWVVYPDYKSARVGYLKDIREYPPDSFALRPPEGMYFARKLKQFHPDVNPKHHIWRADLYFFCPRFIERWKNAILLFVADFPHMRIGGKYLYQQDENRMLQMCVYAWNCYFKEYEEGITGPIEAITIQFKKLKRV